LLLISIHKRVIPDGLYKSQISTIIKKLTIPINYIEIYRLKSLGSGWLKFIGYMEKIFNPGRKYLFSG